MGDMSNHKYHFNPESGNQKTGPIPVTTTSSDSCPATCPFKDKGCYAKYGNLAMHWRALDNGKKSALSLEELCGAIKGLKFGQLWRHNQAGDLPQSGLSAGQDRVIHWPSLEKIIAANKGRRGFTYTHYPVLPESDIDWRAQDNQKIILTALSKGFTINISCETPEQADKVIALGMPAVLVVPEDSPNTWHTPAGNLVKTCPATLYDNVDCKSCGLCQKQHLVGRGGVKRPRHIVAFPPHGSAAKTVSRLVKELRVL